MKRVLSCREHGTLAVGGDNGFNDRELEYLVRLRARGPRFFTEERANGRWWCRFSGYAGAIALPGGRTLEILPKIADDQEARGLIMRMLSAADLAPALEEAPADYAASANLIEAYLRFAADLAVEQARLGLVHSYLRKNLRLPIVRGRLLVAQQLARLPERVDVHIVDTDVFTADTPLNRALKAGVCWAGRVSRSPETQARCREVAARMDAVADIRSDARRLVGTLEMQQLDRRHARLGPLLKILTLLVAGSGGAPEAGIDTPGPTLLFEMSALFEALLEARLRVIAVGCVVRVQDTRFALDVDQRFRLQPDLVVEVSGTPVLVVDAKWKRLPEGVKSVDPSDLRQAFAYARILNTPRAALLYPRLSGTTSVDHEAVVADGSGVRLILRQVSLPTTRWGALDQELSTLLDDPVDSVDERPLRAQLPFVVGPRQALSKGSRQTWGATS